jgi:putative acetyltransferase
MIDRITRIEIREIKQEDNAQLAHIIRSVFDEHNAPHAGTVYCDAATDTLFEVFREPASILWVAEVDKKLVGCCGIFPTRNLPPNCAELVKFYILSEARGKGIGKLLMKKSIDSAKSFGYTELYIESLPAFANAVRIYEKQGFVPLNHPLGESGHSTCNIWLFKKL